MAALVQQRKSLVLILVKQRQNFAWAYITIMIIVIFLLTEKKSIQQKCQLSNSILSRSISNKFDAVDSREVSLNGNAYDFSVDYNAIDKSDILHIHKYLMVKNNIK